MTAGLMAPSGHGGRRVLGSAIVRLLVEKGRSVRSLARNRYPELDALGVTQFQGDVADPVMVGLAVQGCKAVFHVAAKAGLWGPYDEYHTQRRTREASPKPRSKNRTSRRFSTRERIAGNRSTMSQAGS